MRWKLLIDQHGCLLWEYMAEAVKKVAPHFEGLVKWREHAIKELGTDIEIKVSTDPNMVATYGVTHTLDPVSLNYNINSKGEHPSVDVLKEWMKEI